MSVIIPTNSVPDMYYRHFVFALHYNFAKNHVCTPVNAFVQYIAHKDFVIFIWQN